MKFCKKCHKIIITKVYTGKDIANRCRCDRFLFTPTNSEVGGVIMKQLANEKRMGSKRRVYKNMIKNIITE